jgi:FkbM family methyltransferase
MNIKDFIKSLPISTFVEVGCHFGTDTEDFRKFHPNSRIVCFEPDVRNIKVLKERGIDKICELHEVALSDTNGTSSFYLSSGDSRGRVPEKILQENDWSCSSSLKKPTGHLYMHPWITFNNQINVETRRLDDIDSLKNTNIDFMWVDVQGAEDLVFSGAKETLKRTRYLYTEYSNHELYEKQLNRDSILKLIGDGWNVLFDYGGDILLHNMNFNTPNVNN